MPANLLAPDTFIGAVDPDGQLADLWTRERGLVTLVGPVGVGKSRFLREFLRHRPGVLPTEAGYVEPEIPALAVEHGLEAADLEEYVRVAQSQVVVTSRTEPLGIPGETVVVVGPLGAEDSEALLRVRCRERSVPSAHVQRGLPELAAQLGGLPRALERAVDWLETTPAEALALDLAETGIAHPLREEWRQTWARWSEAIRRDLGVVSVFEGGFDLAGAGAMWEAEREDAVARVARLRRCGALRIAGPGRFELFPVVEDLAASGLSDAEREALWIRHSEHFAGLDVAVSWLGVREDWRSTPPVEEVPNLAEAARRTARSRPLCAVRNALSLGFIATRTGGVPAAVHTLQELVEPAAGLDSIWRFRLHYLLAHLHIVGGATDLAVLHAQAALARVPDGMASPQGVILRQMLAWSLWRHGRPIEALRVAEDAAVFAQSLSDRHHAVEFLGLQAMIHAEAGRDEARERCLSDIERVAESPAEEALGAAWFDVCERYRDPPAKLRAPDPRMEARVGVTTTLGRANTLWWLGRLHEARAVVETLPDLKSEPRLARGRDALLGALDVVDRDPANAIGPIRAQLVALETTETIQGAVLYRVALAVALWRLGATAQARGELTRATKDADRVGMAVFRDEFRLLLAVCTAELGGVDAAGGMLDGLRDAWPMDWFRDLEMRARTLVESGPHALPPMPPAPRWSTKLLHRVAAGVSDGDAEVGVELEVGPEVRWLVVAGERIDLGRRATARRFLAALLRRHHHNRGAELTFQEAIEATWPGERMRPESATGRLHTLIWQLRRLGLASVLVTTAFGYAMADGVQVRGELWNFE